MPASGHVGAVSTGFAARAAGRAPRERAAAAARRRARTGRLALRGVALGYLALLLLGPVAVIFYRTFEHGLGAVWNALSTPAAVHALVLSLEVAAIAVPLNTAFGVGMALWLERGRPRGRSLLDVAINLPFAISPVVVGLSLVLVYGRNGWFGSWFAEHGAQIIFSVPGMVMATAVVSLPFVVRETIPVLREIGTDAERAAETLGASPWQVFWRVTLPGIRWGVVYGVVLTTARALGEFGAVSIVSGRIENQTQTLPLYVQDRFENFDSTGAYTAAVVLALLALSTLLAMNLLTRRRAEVS